MLPPCNGNPHTCRLELPVEPPRPNLDTWNSCHGSELAQFYDHLSERRVVDEARLLFRPGVEIAAEYLEIAYHDVQRESAMLYNFIRDALRWNACHPAALAVTGTYT